MSNMKIAIAGCTGRMGQALIKTILAQPDLQLVAGSERAGVDTASLLASIGAGHLFVTPDAKTLVEKSDVIIDFTTPEATLTVAREAAKKGSIVIVGTTGFTAGEQRELEKCASGARIVQSGNFSLGVNLLQALVEKAAGILNEAYDIEINEMHHKHKKDAPSGTALMLGRAAAKGRGVDFDKKKAIDRSGERKVGDIGFSVLRGGDVVGAHDAIFAGPGELISLSHQGFSRDIYANGAVKAARWAADQAPGLYSMRDVLGL